MLPKAGVPEVEILGFLAYPSNLDLGVQNAGENPTQTPGPSLQLMN